jgi:hypothetical protein
MAAPVSISPASFSAEEGNTMQGGDAFRGTRDYDDDYEELRCDAVPTALSSTWQAL